jgi:hypothetical protein
MNWKAEYSVPLLQTALCVASGPNTRVCSMKNKGNILYLCSVLCVVFITSMGLLLQAINIHKYTYGPMNCEELQRKNSENICRLVQ